MRDTDFDVHFICSGNSARSIFAEVLLRDLGRGKFQAFSAGTRPGTALNPHALDVLARNGHATTGLRAKHVSEFQKPGAPVMDFVFTVCDDAAGETCPIWPGHPVTAHWGIEDPSHVLGTPVERERAFGTALRYLENRIKLFIALPFEKLEARALQAQVREIGHGEGASSRRGDAA